MQEKYKMNKKGFVNSERCICEIRNSELKPQNLQPEGKPFVPSRFGRTYYFHVTPLSHHIYGSV